MLELGRVGIPATADPAIGFIKCQLFQALRLNADRQKTAQFQTCGRT